MFLRTSRRAAPKRARHTWMLLMLDECATLAPARVAQLVHSSFELTNRSSSTSSGSSTPTTSGRTNVFSSEAAPPPPALDEAPAERTRAWVAVARLLCEGGNWARAAAVLEGLPASAQQPARHKAVREDWLLPAVVREAWGRGEGVAFAVPAATASVVSSVAAPDARRSGAATQSRTRSLPPPPSRHSSLPPPPQQPPPQQPRVLSSCRTEELVRMAYDLRRPPRSDASVHAAPPTAAVRNDLRGARPSPPPPPPSVFNLQAEMTNILAELQRRGAVADAVQCIINWQRRQLTLLDTEGAATAPSAPTSAHVNALDSVAALKALLFPDAQDTLKGAAASRGGRGAAFAAPSDPHNAPSYSAAHVRLVKELASSHPVVLGRCLQDRVVADRLLRYTSEALTLELATALLLRCVPQSPSGRWPSSTVGGHVADGETYWRAVAVLLLLLHQHLRTQPKVVKERLLDALTAALAGTTSAVSGQAGSSMPRLVASATPSQPARKAPSEGATAAVCLSGEVRQAMRSAVESTCSPLLAHEPQVRFLRLRTFGALAAALVELRVPVPNALAQCMFLCMADASAHAGAEAAATRLSVRSPPTQDAVVAFLSSTPERRWEAALAMLAEAHETGTYRVTAAQERALLSGLQSISLTRTWAAALRVVDVFEGVYSVTPDERSLPTVLLNLKQQSWQDAFRVLRYVPGGTIDGAAPPLLRDLQLVALKHASWEAPLRLMTHLQQRQADGFMNYLYCLCAAARGGDAALAFDHFVSLQRGRGRHTALRALSPYNEVTVAVAAVAMLDYGHTASLARFCALVEKMPRASDSAATGVGAAADAAASIDAAGSLSTPPLTEDGWNMAVAAHLVALLTTQDNTALLQLVLKCPAPALPAVLRWVVVLQCLLGLGHLHAPVRLVFDVVGHRAAAAAAAASASPEAAAAAVPSPAVTEKRAPATPPHSPAQLGDFILAVTQEQLRHGSYETRQRTTVQRRQHLYIPMTHQRTQKKTLSTRWGRFVKAQEALLPPHTERVIAETMVSEGVGTEYLAAVLL